MKVFNIFNPIVKLHIQTKLMVVTGTTRCWSNGSVNSTQQMKSEKNWRILEVTKATYLLAISALNLKIKRFSLFSRCGPSQIIFHDDSCGQVWFNL